MQVMEVMSKLVTERMEVSFGEMSLIRLKSYNSNSGETNFIWKYKEDNKTIAPYYAERLEKRFMRLHRNKSTINK